jgi:hypothetical protein
MPAGRRVFPPVTRALVVLVVWAYAAACSTARQQACLPGEQVECACPGGVRSVQVCQAGGTGYGPCDCGGTVDGDGGTIPDTHQDGPQADVSADMTPPGPCPGVVAITGGTQSSNSIVEGDTVMLSITACTSLAGVPVLYKWSGGGSDVLSTSPNATFNSDDRQGGSQVVIRATAYVDENNQVHRDFPIDVSNIDYGQRVGSIVSTVPSDSRGNLSSDLAVSGTIAYLAVADGTLLASPGYVEAFDISSPTAPRSLGYVATPNDPRIAIASGHVFVLGCSPDELQAYTVAGIAAGDPPVSRVALSGGCSTNAGIVIDGPLAVIQSGSSVSTIDISTPTALPDPVFRVAQPDGGSAGPGFVVAASFLYTAAAEQDASQLRTILRFWDVSDWSSPVEQPVVELRSTFGYASLYGGSGRLYALFNGPTSIFDTSSPSNPSLLGQPVLDSGAVIMLEVDRRILGVNGSALVVYDAANPAAVSRVGDFDLRQHEIGALAVHQAASKYLAVAWHDYQRGVQNAGLDLFLLP